MHEKQSVFSGFHRLPFFDFELWRVGLMYVVFHLLCLMD